VAGWLPGSRDFPSGQRVGLERTPRPGARARPGPGHDCWPAVQGSPVSGHWPQAQRDRRGDAARFSAVCPPDACGSAAPGTCLVAAPTLGWVRLLPGWPTGQSWLVPPVVVL